MRLRDQNVLIAVPRKIMTEKQASSTDSLELLVAWIKILDEMFPFDTVDPDGIRDPQPEQSAKFLKPATIQHIFVLSRLWSAVFVLRILSPDQQGDAELHRHADRNREDRDVLGP